MGACQCENCGQWYNIFGQELIDPEYWEDWKELFIWQILRIINGDCFLTLEWKF
jgi:hypothetical protein